MNISNTGSVRELRSCELTSVSGGVEAEPSVYYKMGEAIGKAYAWARSETADFYEWVASL